MSEIPDDIVEKANAIVHRYYLNDAGMDLPLGQLIARALMEERERCANAVFQMFSPNQGESMDLQAVCVLDAIRSPIQNGDKK